MPILTLKFKKNKIAEYPMQKGRSITIGRRGNNDIVIENLAVSGHHAKIDAIGDGFVLTDLQSKNGCFVNEQLVTSHWLKHGDVVNIGKHTLVFAYKDGESRPEDAAGQADQTIVMDTNLYRDMVNKANPSSTVSPDQKSQTVGVLSYLAGGRSDAD